MASNLSPAALRVHDRLQNDLKFFCKTVLTVKLKEGGEAPFVWNKAQEYLHARIEDQLARTGKVRMFILKGRQQGISTYLAARGYHKATRKRGFRVFILSHHASTTGTLFEIVDRYHDSCPDSIKPKQITNNNRVMEFDNTSKYTVSTAGTGDTARGDTYQFFHWSEVAFSENIDKLLTGAFQTVADVPGTEKFLESTANGVGNYFHTGCISAMEDEDEYELVFIPWHWQDEYRAELPPNFELTEEESKLKIAYNLDDRQLQWRRNKIREFEKNGFGPEKFKQEYPFTVEEAFQSSGERLISAEAVSNARNSRLVNTTAPLILGVDPGPVNDPTAISWRRGPHWIKYVQKLKMGPMELAGYLARTIDKDKVDKVFIDIAEGRGVVDRLHELGYSDIVVGIPFSMRPIDEERYVNKRAEMAGEFKEWIEDPMGVRIPDDDKAAIEIGIHPPFKTTSSGKQQLVSKDEIKKMNRGRSPNIFDSAILTFAQPVKNTYNQSKRVRKRIESQRSELGATNRRRRVQTHEPDDWDDGLGGPARSQSNIRRRK